MGNITYSDMYCTQCGKKNIPVPRKSGREREPGHLKRMYCIYCKKKVNMVEVKNFGSTYTKEDFYWEYENGNFNKKGMRILSFSEFRIKMNKLEKECDVNE